MNFFENQEAARRSSRRLTVLFLVAFAGVIVAVTAVVLAIVANVDAIRQSTSLTWPGLAVAANYPRTVLWTAAIVIVIVAANSASKIFSLRVGGAVVAKLVNATPLDLRTEDIARRRLVNIAEEMSLAAAIPAPSLFILETERSINALIAGYAASDAVLVVTRGALESLSREEMQALVGHEYSHMLNGDMALGMRLYGMLHGLFSVSSLAMSIWYGIPRDDEGNRSVPIVLVIGAPILLIAAVGSLGGTAARIVQAAIVRKRKLLADASAVQFTRNLDALKNVLLKVETSPHGSRFHVTYAEEVAHMLFASEGRKMFATHPTIPDRIAAIDGSFGDRDVQAMRQRQAQESQKYERSRAEAAGQFEQKKKAFAAAREQLSELTTTSHLAEPADMASQIQAVVHSMVESSRARTTDVRPMFFAFLLDMDPEIRLRQLDFLSRVIGGDQIPKIEAALKETDAVKPMHRLPAILKLYQDIKELPQDRRKQMLTAINSIMQREGHNIQSYVNRKLAQVLLRDQLEAGARAYSLKLSVVKAEVELLLSVLALQGHSDSNLAKSAYSQGLKRVFPTVTPRYNVPENWWNLLDIALNKLDRLAPADKQTLAAAMAVVIVHDRQLSITESEFFRVVCATLHCPAPSLRQFVADAPRSSPVPV